MNNQREVYEDKKTGNFVPVLDADQASLIRCLKEANEERGQMIEKLCDELVNQGDMVAALKALRGAVIYKELAGRFDSWDRLNFEHPMNMVKAAIDRYEKQSSRRVNREKYEEGQNEDRMASME
jgi:hypothetical protein